MDPRSRVLVGYATAAGSTAGIAERIAGILRASGCEVVCRPLGADLDPAPFDALVLGSAVHNMAWLRPALDLLGRVPAGGNQPTWCFSVGGVAPSGPVTRHMTALEVRKVETTFPAGLSVREHRFFGGIVQMAGVPLWGRIFWRLVGGRAGDHRDWPAIDSWAEQIAAALAPGPRAARTTPRRPVRPGPSDPRGGREIPLGRRHAGRSRHLTDAGGRGPPRTRSPPASSGSCRALHPRVPSSPTSSWPTPSPGGGRS